MIGGQTILFGNQLIVSDSDGESDGAGNGEGVNAIRKSTIRSRSL